MQQGAEAQSEREIAERVARLETAAQYDRRISSEKMSDLWLRIHRLEKFLFQARESPPYLATIKLGLAILIPLAVWLVTGNQERASEAAKLVSKYEQRLKK